MTMTITKESGTRTGGSGSTVLRITALVPEPPSYVYAQAASLTLEEGIEYQITGWVRSDAAEEFGPIVRLDATDDSGSVDIYSPAGSSSWQNFDVTYTPAKDSYLQLGGEIGGSAPSGYYFEYDDVEVWKTGDEASDPLLYWTEGNSATLAKTTDSPYEGEQDLKVSIEDDITQHDISIDERSDYVDEAFLMHDSGSNELLSRKLYVYVPS